MKNGQGHISPRLFGEAEDVGVQRGLAEFRAGRPVIIQAASEAVFALPVERGDAHRFAAFNTLLAPASPRLAITARRAKALGLDASDPVLLELTPSDDWDAIFALAVDADNDRPVVASPAGAGGGDRHGPGPPGPPPARLGVGECRAGGPGPL